MSPPPDHREVVPGVRPVVEEREDPETLRPDERLRTDYRDDEPFARYSRQIISASIWPPVGAYALELVRLVEGMVVRYPVDRRRGDARRA